jgi:type I restriction enzyme M protein
LKESKGASAKHELNELKKLDAIIKKIEEKIKDAKAELKGKTAELELKLELKRLGGEGFTAESRELIRQVDKQILELDSKDKTDKKKIEALQKDKAALESRIARTDALLKEIGGQLIEKQTKQLILKKLYTTLPAENWNATSMPKNGRSFRVWKISGINTPSVAGNWSSSGNRRYLN